MLKLSPLCQLILTDMPIAFWLKFTPFVILLLEVNVFFKLMSFPNNGVLTLPVPIPDEEKKLKFLFSHFLWCLRRFYEGLKGFHKTFWGITKKCENKNLTSFFLFVRDWDGKAFLVLIQLFEMHEARRAKVSVSPLYLPVLFDNIFLLSHVHQLNCNTALHLRLLHQPIHDDIFAELFL